MQQSYVDLEMLYEQAYLATTIIVSPEHMFQKEATSTLLILQRLISQLDALNTSIENLETYYHGNSNKCKETKKLKNRTERLIETIQKEIDKFEKYYLNNEEDTEVND